MILPPSQLLHNAQELCPVQADSKPENHRQYSCLSFHTIDNHSHSTGIIGYRIDQDKRTARFILPVRIKEQFFSCSKHHTCNFVQRQKGTDECSIVLTSTLYFMLSIRVRLTFVVCLIKNDLLISIGSSSIHTNIASKLRSTIGKLSG